MARVTIVSSDALAGIAAERLTELIAASVAARGNAVVSLTGGSTPKRTYEALADPARPWRNRIAWERVYLFWGDERHVPPDDPQSNFGMAKRALLDHVPVPPEQVFRMRGEMADARAAAGEYREQLRAGFAAAGRGDQVFDVMLLGLGEDAHIASIFPGSPLLDPRDRGVIGAAPDDGRPGPAAAIFAPHLQAWRLTLTPAAILQSRAIVMLVAGEHKTAAVAAAIEAPLDVERYPAQVLREAGERVEWLLDRAAAARLSSA